MDPEGGRGGSPDLDAAASSNVQVRPKRDGETMEHYERSLREAFEVIMRRQMSLEFPATSMPSSVTSAAKEAYEISPVKKPRLECESNEKSSLKRNASQLSPSVPSTSRDYQILKAVIDDSLPQETPALRCPWPKEVQTPSQGSPVSTDFVTPGLTTSLVPSTNSDNIENASNAFQTLSLIGAASVTQPEQKRYKKRSGVANSSGEDFEWKMLTLVFLRLLHAGFEFQLASNMEAAGQFDDIVIKYWKHSKDPTKTPTKCACLQLKHKKNNEIHLTELLGFQDYSLVKYCNSFVSVNSSINKELDLFEDCQIILFTNASIDGDLVTILESEPLLSTGGKVVSFKPDGKVYQRLCEWVDFKETLTKLHRQVARLSDKEVRIRVKDAFEAVEYQNKAVESWKNELFTTPTLKTLNNLLKKMEIVSDKAMYSLFLTKLQIYTDQAHVAKLDNKIKEKLAKVWSRGESPDAAMFHELQSKMKSWWQNESIYLTHDSPLWLGIIKSQAETLSKSTIDGLTKSGGEFSEYCLQVFNQSIKIYEFPSVCGILHIRVDFRTAASSLKMHQGLAKFGAWGLNALHVNMKALLDHENAVFSAWSTKWCRLLVVECDSEMELKQATRISARILKVFAGKGKNKLLVLIAPETHELNDLLFNAKNYSRFNDNVGWSDLTPKTRELFLSGQVVFNGVQLPLSLTELLDGDKGFVNKAGLDVVSQLLTGDLRCGKDLDEESEFFVTRRLKESADGNAFVVNSVSDVRRKVVLVVAGPGMGKSMLLTHLAKSAKEEDSTAWILHIKLNDCVQYLKTIDLVHFNKATVMKLLEQSALSPKNILEKLLLRTLEHKLVIFVDGVDEVCPNYEEQVFTLLSFLKDMKFCQLWVASRPVFQTKLEDKLKVKMLHLVPFSEDDQKDFFNKVWRANVPDPEKCHKESANLLSWLTDSLGKENPILGIPLMTVMIAETFHEQMFSLNGADDKFKRRERLDVMNLYKYFIEKKFYLYCTEKKKSQNRDLAANINDEETLLKRILHNHRLAALRVLFTQNDINDMQFEGKRKLNKDLTAYLAEVSDGREKMGIIAEVIEGTPQFIHRSIAEYLAATILVDNFGTNVWIIKRTLFDQSRTLLSEMFHRLLAENHPLHVAVLNRDIKNVMSIPSAQPKSTDVNELDAGGRTPLHLAVLVSATDPHPDCILILKYLIEEHSAKLDIADKVLKWGPLRYAYRSGAWAALQIILENGGHVMEGREGWPAPHPSLDAARNDAVRNARLLVVCYLVEERGGVLSCLGQEGASLIHTEEARGGNVEVLEYLRTKGLVLHHRDNNRNTALRYAALAALRYLLKLGIYLEAVNIWGTTVLQDAAQNGDNDAMTAFLEVNVSFDASAETPKSRRNAYLLFAAFSGNLESVKKLVEIGAEVSHRDNKRQTAALIALHRKHIEVARWLLQLTTDEFDSSLHIACRDGDLAIVSFLMLENADIEAVSARTEMTPLLEASQAGHLDVVKLLLEKGADVNCCDKYGKTNLHGASSSGDEQVVALLIKYGADVNVADYCGRTPLQIAFGHGNNEIAALLIKRGADVNLKDNYGRTPLEIVVGQGSNEIAALLIKHGAHINVVDKYGRTTLHTASKKEYHEIAALLIKHGADVNIADNESRTPLQIVVEQGSNEIAALLMKNGADINVADNYGRTTLHTASKKGYKEIAALLIEHGADVTVTDNEGRTPLQIACGQGNNKIAALLKKHDADVHAQDHRGRTPLSLTTEQL